MSFVAETLSRTRKIRQFTNLCIPIFLFNDRANRTVVNAKRERVGADRKIEDVSINNEYEYENDISRTRTRSRFLSFLC